MTGRPRKGEDTRISLCARVDREAVALIHKERKKREQTLGDYLTEHGLTLKTKGKA